MPNLPSNVSSDAWLAAIVECSGDAIISKTLDGIVTSWNASAERIFGYDAQEMVGSSILTIIPDDRRQEEELILGSIRRDQRLEHFETKRRRKDGTLVDISLTVSAIKDERGTIVGVSKIARDISEERRSRATQRLLMREVNHRAKNLLAVVEAIVRQTVESSSPTSFRLAISDRIAALSRTHDLIVSGDWQGVDLRELVLAHVADAAGQVSEAYAIAGPSVRISPNATQALGIALHELFVGSAQRLQRSRSGTITISWRTDQEGQSLAFAWVEVLQAEATGPDADDAFSRTVLTKVAPMSLNGVSTLSASERGWRWTLTTKSDAAFGPQIVDPLGQSVG